MANINITTTELLSLLDITPADQNLVLVGNHGIGKSEILTDYFSGKGMKVVPLFLGQMSDPGDLIGIPNRNDTTGKTEFMPPYWFPLDGKPVVLFLDELNRARPEVLQTIMDLALNRTLAGRRLPDGSRIISAVNAGDQYQLTDLDPALVSRFNRFYGTGWRAKPRFFTKNDKCGNIVISCVDSVKARLVVDKAFENCKRTSRCNEDSCFYWMDLGNGQTTGQCFIGSIEISQPSSENCLAVSLLPTISTEIDLSSVNEEESGPSCSMAEALQKQDLFINSTLCELAGSLLWSLFKDNSLEYRGFYINLETMRVVPVGV